jgi:hypothetical protein
MAKKIGCHVSFLPHLKQAIKTSQHRPQDVFNIVTHPKFASGVSEKYGKRHLDLLCAGHSWQSALSSTAGKTRQLKVQ